MILLVYWRCILNIVKVCYGMQLFRQCFVEYLRFYFDLGGEELRKYCISSSIRYHSNVSLDRFFQDYTVLFGSMKFLSEVRNLQAAHS